MKQILLAFLLLTTLGSGQVLTPEEISAQIELQKENSAQGDSQAVLAVWEEAKTLSEQLGAVKATGASFQAMETSEGKLPELKDISAPADEANLEDLSKALTEVTSALESSTKRLSQAMVDLKDAPDRISVLLGLISEARAQMSEVATPPEGGTELAKAQRELSLLRTSFLEASVERFQSERIFLQSELANLPERIRLRKEHNRRLVQLQANLQVQVANLRRQEAQNTEIELERSAQELSHIPELGVIIAEISELNQQRTGKGGVQAQIKDATKYARKITRLYQSVEAQKRNAQEKIELLESVGLEIDTDTGIILREQRAELPSTVDLEKELRGKVEIAVRNQVTLLELSEKQTGDQPLSNKVIKALSEKEVDRILAEDPVLQRSEVMVRFEQQVTALFEQRRSLLETLISERKSLNTTLKKSNSQAQLTINAINSYSVFLDQRLLWSRSTTPIRLTEPRSEIANIRTLFGGGMFEKAWASIQENWFPRFFPVLAFATLFLFGLFRRLRLRKLEKESSEQACKRNCTSIKPTVITIVSSVLIAGTFPALLFLLALLISDPMPYRMGLLNAGLFLFVASLLYRFSKPAALFEAHFKFSMIKAKRIRNTLRFFIPIILPFVFGIGALSVNGGVGSSGRVVFIVTMLLVSTVAHQLFHPKHSIVGNPEKPTLLSRLSYVMALGLPLSFLVGAALGFFSSVLTLRAQVLATAGVLLGAFLVIRFFTRWILVSRRRLAIQQALLRREATLAERARKESGELESEPDVASLEEVKAQAVDVVEVEQQTSQLLRFGVYFSVFFAIFSIWSSSLTALSVLDQKPLNPRIKPRVVEITKRESSPAMSVFVPQQGAKADETASEQAGDPIVEKSDPITELVLPPKDFVSWQDLLLSLFIFLLTFVAARNIPGLLSLAVFSRLNLGPGGNFAFTTMVRYFIVLTGVVIGLNKIGITWDKVQWLAAAITLGIGFGLQEIFANFVAGLILLFERPLRLGDIVTIGNVSGKVTEIKIRATTIQQFNNRDLVVPNKDFITGQLTNWTLRDSVLRFELAVGIAYGSDTRKAEEILNRIVMEHPNVLADPAPAVIFNSFGASTLDFLIRAHVGQTGNLVSTQSDLHFQIDDAFREAGIELAFPQQDIHVRSLPDGVVLPPVGPK
ncbi:MAG: mechanosensitive ion channel domain-containing protein [Roseibacillus sp.]